MRRASGRGLRLPDTESFRAPDSTNLFRRLSVTSFRDKELSPVTAADLVDTAGNCAGAYVPANGDQPGGGDVPLKEAGVPMIPAAIGLEMTECDVVKRAGIPDRVEIGGNGAASARPRSPTCEAIGPGIMPSSTAG